MRSVWLALKLCAWALLYRLACATRKDASLWAVTSWLGKDYNDNARVLFEHVRSLPETERPRVVWVTKSWELRNELKLRRLPCHWAYSPWGLRAQFSAAITISPATTAFDFVTGANGGSFKVLLWHGFGPKALQSKWKQHRKAEYLPDVGENFPLRKMMLPLVNLLAGTKLTDLATAPFLQPYEFDQLLCLSEPGRRKLMTTFTARKQHIIATGFARNDAAFSGRQDDYRLREQLLEQRGGGCFTVLYAPTFRKEGYEDLFETQAALFDELDEICRKQRIKIHLKLHPIVQPRHDLLARWPSIRLLQREDYDLDVYRMFADVDALMTDYSSIYTDFILWRKPVLFLVPDWDEYNTNDRSFSSDYAELTPGPKCRTAREFAEAVEQLRVPEMFARDWLPAQQRRIAAAHDFLDADSARRCFEAIRDRTGARTPAEERAWQRTRAVRAGDADALAYLDHIEHVRHAIAQRTSPDATMLVASKGEELWMDLPVKRCWHFPMDAQGGFAGHHFADGAEAVAALEAARARGATHLLLPAASLWWLEHYPEFAGHLAANYQRNLFEPGKFALFYLKERTGASPA